MLCRRYSAEQALALGLVDEVGTDGTTEAAVQSLLDELHQLSPSANSLLVN